MELSLGLGVGLTSVVLIVILGFIRDQRMGARADKDADLREKAVAEVVQVTSERDALRANVTSLELETKRLRTTSEVLTARLAAAEKVTNDLLSTVAVSQPGALPSALRAQLDRLRTHVSPDDEAATSGDSSRGTPGVVHGTIEVKPT